MVEQLSQHTSFTFLFFFLIISFSHFKLNIIMAKKESTVMAMRKKLLKKKAELLGTENPVYKTSGMFRRNTYSQAGEFDVRTASKSKLLDGYKSLYNHVEAAKELGVDITHLGFTAEEWKHDFKLRVAVLDRADTIRFIEVTETKLRTVLTRSELRQIGIEDLMEDVEKITG